MKSRKSEKICSLPIPTTEGTFVAHYSERGLAGLDFPSRKNVAASSPANPAARLVAWHRLTTRALMQALSGHEPGQLPPLDARGTSFQQSVWKQLQAIRTGQVRTYGELARLLGRPRAARAVGGACGANPIPVLVPCHRVLASGNALGGFSGGLDWKRKLLALEGRVAV